MNTVGTDPFSTAQPLLRATTTATTSELQLATRNRLAHASIHRPECNLTRKTRQGYAPHAHIQPNKLQKGSCFPSFRIILSKDSDRQYCLY